MGNEDAVRDSRLIWGGFATLISFLLGSTMWSATHPDDGSARLVFIASVAFGLVAAYGLTRPVLLHLRGRAVWMLTLTVLWVVLAVLEPTANYMVVALFALYLYRLPLWWGVAATLVVMPIAAGLGLLAVGGAEHRGGHRPGDGRFRRHGSGGHRRGGLHGQRGPAGAHR